MTAPTLLTTKLSCLTHLDNLDGNGSERPRIQGCSRRLDNISVVNVRDGKGVGLRSPGAAPVNVADLGLPIVDIIRSFRSGRGIRSATGSNLRVLAGGCDLGLGIIGGDLSVLVADLMELAPGNILAWI